jgi:hypothetical protein
LSSVFGVEAGKAPAAARCSEPESWSIPRFFRGVLKAVAGEDRWCEAGTTAAAAAEVASAAAASNAGAGSFPIQASPSTRRWFGEGKARGLEGGEGDEAKDEDEDSPAEESSSLSLSLSLP